MLVCNVLKLHGLCMSDGFLADTVILSIRLYTIGLLVYLYNIGAVQWIARSVRKPRYYTCAADVLFLCGTWAFSYSTFTNIFFYIL